MQYLLPLWCALLSATMPWVRLQIQAVVSHHLAAEDNCKRNDVCCCIQQSTRGNSIVFVLDTVLGMV